MMYGYWAVARKELLHLLRDNRSLFLVVVMPIFQVCMYGFAIDFDVRHIPTVLVDSDRSQESRQYVQQLHTTQYLDFTAEAASPEEAISKLRAGSARAAVVIPPDFSRRLLAGASPAVGVLVDGSDSQVSLRAHLAFTQAPVGGTTVQPRTTVLFNPNSRTALFMIPGIIGMMLQVILTALTSGSIVKERGQGSLEQLMVTPVSPYGLMLGKLTPCFALAVGEIALILTVGYVLFDVRVVGSLVLLVLMSMPFLVGALGQGLYISASARNQAQAMQLSQLFFLPQMLMSGFIFPRETLPGPLYLLSNFMPLTHELNILRGIVVRGASGVELLPSFAAACGLMLFWIYAASRRFTASVA